MTPLANAISRALIHFVWQGAIAGLSLWVILIALRRRSANSRYVASCAALAAMALMPVITTAILYFAQTAPGATGASAVYGAPIASFTARALGTQPPAVFAWLQAWALPIWSFGVVLFSSRLILGYNHAFTLGRKGRPAGESIVALVARLKRLMGIARPVRVLISSIVETPSVVGWIRPVVLLPAATLIGLTPLQLEAIVAHELGHIKRYDYFVNMLQMLAETLLFYHPAIWWASRRVRLERELCCDDLAVRYSGNALRYARALTVLEKLRLRAPQTAMASTGGPLMYRIQRLTGLTPKEHGPSRLPALFAVTLGILCFALNVSWVRGQDAPGVTVDLGSSSVIHRTRVSYPEAAQKQGITGKVQVEAKLDSTGNVADARVLSGPEELRKAALESVLDWHFTRDAARGTRLITISFTEAGKQVHVGEPRLLEGEWGGQVEGKLISLNQENGEVLKLENAKLFFFEQQQQLTPGQRLEREIGNAQRELEKLRASSAPPEQRAEMELKLQKMKREFEMTQWESSAGRGNLLVGRPLKAIYTLFLPESVRVDLLSRLPVREGDLLSSQLIEQTSAAVRAYDEHLRVQFMTNDEGQIELRISAPNEQR